MYTVKKSKVKTKIKPTQQQPLTYGSVDLITFKPRWKTILFDAFLLLLLFAALIAYIWVMPLVFN